MKINKYRIVINHIKAGIEEDINTLIEQGWQPHGNLIVDNPYIYQAMAKYDNTEKECGYIPEQPKII